MLICKYIELPISWRHNGANLKKLDQSLKSLAKLVWEQFRNDKAIKILLLKNTVTFIFDLKHFMDDFIEMFVGRFVTVISQGL